MSLLAQAKQVAKTEDQTEVQKGFDYKPTPAGFSPARFIGYVELGKQKQRAYQGKEKPDALEARLTFELNGPAHINEYEKDGVKQSYTNTINVTLPVSSNEKSNYYKLLSKMIAGRQNIKHMAEMLEEPFLVKVVHNVVEKDGKKTTYANIKDGDGWHIGAPFKTDVLTNETTPIEVPAQTHPTQFLSWSSPSKEQWDSIFIDGSYTKGEGDDAVEVSKNFIQDKCYQATDYNGSALSELLGGAGDIGAEMAKEVEAPKTEPKKEEPKKEVASEDVLVGLGLKL